MILAGMLPMAKPLLMACFGGVSQILVQDFAHSLHASYAASPSLVSNVWLFVTASILQGHRYGTAKWVSPSTQLCGGFHRTWCLFYLDLDDWESSCSHVICLAGSHPMIMISISLPHRHMTHTGTRNALGFPSTCIVFWSHFRANWTVFFVSMATMCSLSFFFFFFSQYLLLLSRSCILLRSCWSCCCFVFLFVCFGFGVDFGFDFFDFDKSSWACWNCRDHLSTNKIMSWKIMRDEQQET